MKLRLWIYHVQITKRKPKTRTLGKLFVNSWRVRYDFFLYGFMNVNTPRENFSIKKSWNERLNNNFMKTMRGMKLIMKCLDSWMNEHITFILNHVFVFNEFKKMNWADWMNSSFFFFSQVVLDYLNLNASKFGSQIVFDWLLRNNFQIREKKKNQ